MLTLDSAPSRLVKLSLLLLLALAVFPVTSAAQQEEAKPEVEVTAEMAAVQDIALARQLMLYGHRTGTPEPYIAAARIMIETPISDPTYERREEVADAAADSDKEGAGKLTVIELLATARELAGDDENMLAVIMELEASMTKDRVGGPATANDRVEANSYIYYEEAFRGGETALFEVVGDGDTDLDCYVYDENENLITSDTDYTDHCVLIWTPPRTQAYVIVIENLGTVWNGIVVSTN
jgi:hypothetical protein